MKAIKKTDSSDKLIDNAERSYESVRLILAVLLAAMFAAVFFAMAIGISELYPSDSPQHIYYGSRLEGYSLESIFIYGVSRMTGYPLLQFVFAVAETAVVLLTWMLTQKLIDHYFSINRWIILGIATGLLFLSSIYIPKFYPYFYRYSLGTQSWHNSTQFGMRFLAVAFLYVFFGVYPHYLEGISVKQWFELAGLLMLSTLCKPNFMLSFSATILIVVFLDVLKYKNRDTMKKAFKLMTILVPSLAVLALQSLVLYGEGDVDNSGIAIVGFSSLLWEGGSLHMVLKFLRELAFPLIVWTSARFFRKDKSDRDKFRNLSFVILMYLLSIGVFSVFIETGGRARHGNFGWGATVCYYTMFLYAVPLFFENMTETIKVKGENSLNGAKRKLAVPAYYIFGNLLLLLHLCSGLVYFFIVLRGRSFYC